MAGGEVYNERTGVKLTGNIDLTLNERKVRSLTFTAQDAGNVFQSLLQTPENPKLEKSLKLSMTAAYENLASTIKDISKAEKIKEPTELISKINKVKEALNKKDPDQKAFDDAVLLTNSIKEFRERLKKDDYKEVLSQNMWTATTVALLYGIAYPSNEIGIRADVLIKCANSIYDSDDNIKVNFPDEPFGSSALGSREYGPAGTRYFTISRNDFLGTK